MAHYCSILPKTKRNLLVFGYNRQNNHHCTPVVITKLCFKYYNEIINWKISGKELDKFYNCSVADCLNGPSFKINNIEFSLSIYPNGKRTKYSGGVGFYCRYAEKLLPANIDHFVYYVRLFCDEIKYEYRCVTECGENFYNGSGWNMKNMLLKECKKLNTKELNFGCHAQLLHVFYNDNKTTDFTKDIEMKTSFACQWNLNKDELVRFNAAKFNNSLYSRQFNHSCWCVMITPNGSLFKTDSKGYMYLTLKLHKLPYGVKSIDVEFEVDIKSESCHHQFDKKAIFSYEHSAHFNDVKIPFSMYSNAKKMCINVKVKIIGVQSMMAKNDMFMFIPISKWVKKGFIQ